MNAQLRALGRLQRIALPHIQALVDASEQERRIRCLYAVAADSVGSAVRSIDASPCPWGPRSWGWIWESSVESRGITTRSSPRVAPRVCWHWSRADPRPDVVRREGRQIRLQPRVALIKSAASLAGARSRRVAQRGGWRRDQGKFDESLGWQQQSAFGRGHRGVP